jgi:hypothetical protein
MTSITGSLILKYLELFEFKTFDRNLVHNATKTTEDKKFTMIIELLF